MSHDSAQFCPREGIMHSINLLSAIAVLAIASVPELSAQAGVDCSKVRAGSTHPAAMDHLAHAQAIRDCDGPLPTSPGQAAFGAISEIVRLLKADPNTDWSKVNIEALRQHLID